MQEGIILNPESTSVIRIFFTNLKLLCSNIFNSNINIFLPYSPFISGSGRFLSTHVTRLYASWSMRVQTGRGMKGRTWRSSQANKESGERGTQPARVSKTLLWGNRVSGFATFSLKLVTISGNFRAGQRASGPHKSRRPSTARRALACRPPRCRCALKAGRCYKTISAIWFNYSGTRGPGLILTKYTAAQESLWRILHPGQARIPVGHAAL